MRLPGFRFLIVKTVHANQDTTTHSVQKIRFRVQNKHVHTVVN